MAPSVASPPLTFHDIDHAGAVVASYTSDAKGLHERRSRAPRDGIVNVGVISEADLHKTSRAYWPSSWTSITTGLQSTIRQCLAEAFLPAGYPHSVTDDYLEYQIYDSLQAFASAVAGMISNRALLEGIGVGDATATPQSAMLLSVLQNTFGRLSTIVFAARYGLSLEAECKRYRFLADLVNDAAILLDCLSPLLPPAGRVPALVLARVLSSLCGVMAGAAKASLSAHFARRGNLGELNAKDASQEQVLSLLGMLVGTAVIAVLEGRLVSWLALVGLLVVHLSCNYQAVRAVSLRTLNRQRACAVLSAVVDAETTGEKDNAITLSTHSIPSPKHVARHERIFEAPDALRWQAGSIIGHAKIGIPMSSIISDLVQGQNDSARTSAYMQRLVEIYAHVGWITYYSRTSRVFLIVLKRDVAPRQHPSSVTDMATAFDESNPSTREAHNSVNAHVELAAWLHALLCARSLRASDQRDAQGTTRTPAAGSNTPDIHAATRDPSRHITDDQMLSIVKASLETVEMLVAAGLWERLAERGWDLETGALVTTAERRVVVLGESVGEEMKKDL